MPALAVVLLLPLTAMAADSRFADAAATADSARLRTLLATPASGPGVNAPQVDGMTALHWAVRHDDFELTALLLEHGADATTANRYGVTPLSLACENGNAAIVARLLEAGVDANTILPGGETVLMTAARTGKPGPVTTLLDHGAIIDADSCEGQTALMWAAAEGHTDVVRLLLERGADPRATLESGFNACFFAVRAGHREVAKAFLAAGLDVNSTFERQTRNRRMPRRGTSALMLAMENGHFELAVDLLEAGADPNDQRSGFTPLHALSWVRRSDRGDDADPPPIPSGPMTSLDFARELVAHGADVNARLQTGKTGRARINPIGKTPFIMACATADVALMSTLFELGADPLMPNSENSTPLMVAAGLGTLAPDEEPGTEDEAIEAIGFLLAQGADINAVDDNCETAMHGATYKSFPRVARFLAEKGADIETWNHRNKHEWTPLHIAQGYRPGNFKPSHETIEAIESIFLAAGRAIPTDPPPAIGDNY